MEIINKLNNKIKFLLKYYIKFQGDIISYLRYTGVRIGQDCELLNKSENYGSEPWLIEIGNNSTISSGVFFITHDASSRLFRNNLPNSSIYGNQFGKIRIHDNCFIGINSIILPNVQIGPNSIVGAGSVITKDVPPNTVVAGIPARRISTVDEYIEKYIKKMVPIISNDRQNLRKELTKYFWGQER